MARLTWGSRRRLAGMGWVVDLMHLVVIVAGVALGAWALIGLRRTLPRGRFAVFALTSAGALFGCAALAGEVGLLSPPAWFGVVMVAMAIVTAVALRAASPRAATVRP